MSERADAYRQEKEAVMPSIFFSPGFWLGLIFGFILVFFALWRR